MKERLDLYKKYVRTNYLRKISETIINIFLVFVPVSYISVLTCMMLDIDISDNIKKYYQFSTWGIIIVILVVVYYHNKKKVTSTLRDIVEVKLDTNSLYGYTRLVCAYHGVTPNSLKEEKGVMDEEALISVNDKYVSICIFFTDTTVGNLNIYIFCFEHEDVQSDNIYSDISLDFTTRLTDYEENLISIKTLLPNIK